LRSQIRDLGIANLHRNKFKESISAFKMSLSVKPDYYDAQVAMGMTYQRFEKWEEAVNVLRKADEMKPDNYEVLSALAKSLMKLKRTGELEQVYLRMLELNPEEHSLLLYLGQIAFYDGRQEEGLKKIEKALQMNEESVMGWNLYSSVLESLGRKEDAHLARENYKLLMDGQKKLHRFWGY